MKKRKITAEDLLNLKFVDGIAMSPEESEIAINIRTVASDRKKYYSHIYMANSDGTDLRQFTSGEVSDSLPTFSPNGKWLAFSSKRGDKKGLYIMPRRGGEARLLSDMDGSYSEISFSPDSKKILCSFRKNDDVPKNKDGKKEAPVYRHITRMFYKADNYGFLPKEEGQLWTIDIRDGKAVQLTKGGQSKGSPTFSPDGRTIAYITNVQRNPDLDADLIDVFIMSANGGKPRMVDTPKGPKAGVRFSPDGKWIAYLGHDNPNDSWGVTNYHVWKVPVRGGKAVDLTKKLDRMCVDETISDTVEAHSSGLLQWSPDGRWIYCIVSDAGTTNFFRVSASGRILEPIVTGKQHVMGVALDGRATKAALVISNHIQPAEVYSLSFTKIGAKPVKITSFNKWLSDEVMISKPEEVIFRSAGGYPVHGWIMRPPDFKPGRKYPSILEIHGGPRVQFGNTFFHEMQFLAANGYVVYFSNPRGGQGYGEKHADSITNGWGTVDYEDCMAFADFMEEKPYIDRKKMGVTGGSYGGFMTNWIVGHTNRFAAAITQRSVVNLESMFGSSDIGFHVPREIFGTPYNNTESWRRMSPLTYVKNIRTPLLISHSEQDLRCPIEQAEQLFISLKMLGRTVEFIRFPDEPHGLSRCGRPDRRLARLEWFLKWFDRYLIGKKR
ncbi:MAG: S9 family peptidase [Candidatus Zixiibacteriota bacterium]